MMKNRKVHNSNAPGCLGRMVNLFDINPGVPVNKLIMDKPHYDGPLRARSRSDGASSISPTEDPLEDKLIILEQRRSASDRTPMKTLIDHEMSKEEPKDNPPNLVAKLMGLDALPRQHTDSVPHRTQSKTHEISSAMQFEKPKGRHTDTRVSDKKMKYEADYKKQKDYKDVYEIWKHAQGENFVNDVSSQRSRNVKDIDEKQMSIVRQKFVEAKRLVTDEKLRQSKAFQDALEVLSSNRDLFLRCLQEPDSLFTQQMYGKYTDPKTSETKRITVLKPTKIEEYEKFPVSENKKENHAKNSVPVALAHGRSKSNDECSSTFSHWDPDNTLPTRIVVLKPSIITARGNGSMGSIQGKDYFSEAKVFNTNDSRDVAKEITRQMHAKLMGRQSDETLISSVFSNGYNGDESSMNKSDTEYDGESDSEVMSTTSRHSWDYINRFSSHFESLSFSRASCSPESSVCREAKKRLSERWAMVALHGNPPENRHVRRKSSTLGEMLALSNRKSQTSKEEVGFQATRKSTTTYELAKDDMLLDPSRSLMRSKSVPVSSSVYGDRLNVELSGPVVSKPEEYREAKTNSTKNSFKGKLSSLFFSKNKKVKKVAYNAPEAENLPHISTLGTLEHFIENNNLKTSMLVSDNVSEESIHFSLQVSNRDMASSKAGLSAWRTANSNDNQGQPSPISVLETSFGENGTSALEFANCNKAQGSQALGHHLKSCLIDKSPPIGSISRTISRQDSCSSESATMFPITNSIVPMESESEEDWFQFVQTLLADSGIGNDDQSDSLATRWHSTDCPLDPFLCEKYINLNKKSLAYEANLRQWRSSCKLMYDCVNTALVDITRSHKPGSKQRLQCPNGISSEGHSRIPLTDEVWTRIKEWINYDARSVVGVDSDSKNRLLVESVVKNEVVGKCWVENVRVEIDVGEEIEEKLLEELVEDAVLAASAGRYL